MVKAEAPPIKNVLFAPMPLFVSYVVIRPISLVRTCMRYNMWLYNIVLQGVFVGLRQKEKKLL